MSRNGVERYENNWQHLADELAWLDGKIQLLLREQQTQTVTDEGLDPFRGLVVSEQEVWNLLHDASESLEMDEDWWVFQAELQHMESMIAKRVEQSLAEGVDLALPALAQRFGLSKFEERCLLICLAVECHRKYEKLFAYLQDDVTCKHPTFDLVLRMLCRTQEERMVALTDLVRSNSFLTFFLNKGDGQGNGTLLSRQLQLDERIVRYALYRTDTDPELTRLAETHGSDADWPPLLWEIEKQDQLVRYVGEAGQRTRFWISGHSGSGKTLHVKHLCKRLGRKLILFDLQQALQQDKPLRDLVQRGLREARLQCAVLAFRRVDALLKSDQGDKLLTQFMEEIRSHPDLVFLLGEQPLRTAGIRETKLIEIGLQVPPDEVRREVWQQLGVTCTFAETVDWGAMAGKFRFTVGQMERALHVAKQTAMWQGTAEEISLRILHNACYSQVQHNLQKKATRIEPRHTFDQLVLPPEQKSQLKNACNQMKYRSLVFGEWGFSRRLSYGKGLSMLFAGPPGTGKTMSAEVIAKELSLEIYKIDLSQIISKYIGETEKNLQEIFAEAQLSSSILFFDEADALFGKRSEVKDSHDKYANVEIAYLLQKMEEYEGVTILATNFQQNIDEAFMRRINYVVRFPFPDTGHREMLWRGMFPEETPLDEDVDFGYIAEKFQFAGGHIKNIVTSAAFMAAETGSPVGMKHIIRAVKHELEKTGKLLLKHEVEEFGEYLTPDR